MSGLVDLEKKLRRFPIFKLPNAIFPVEILDEKEKFERWHRKFSEMFVAFKNTHIILSEDEYERRYEKILNIEKQLKELGVDLKDCVVVPKQKLREFCVDVLQLIAGIGWFNVDEEKERVYAFIESKFPNMLNDRIEQSEKELLNASSIDTGSANDKETSTK